MASGAGRCCDVRNPCRGAASRAHRDRRLSRDQHPRRARHRRGCCHPSRVDLGQLMRRAFDLDAQACPNCGGRLQLIATIVDPRTIRPSCSPWAGAQRWPSAPHPCSAPPPDPFSPILTRDPVPRPGHDRPAVSAHLDLRPAPARTLRTTRLTAGSTVLYQAGTRRDRSNAQPGSRPGFVRAVQRGGAMSEYGLYVTYDPRASPRALSSRSTVRQLSPLSR